jgi:hypothetical protein
MTASSQNTHNLIKVDAGLSLVAGDRRNSTPIPPLIAGYFFFFKVSFISG